MYEMPASAGSSTESFPLFGFSLDDYDELYAEKLELLGTRVKPMVDAELGASKSMERAA